MISVTSTVSVRERRCLVCTQPAVCQNYGITTCNACKMFYRRTLVEKLSYRCNHDNKCLEKEPPNKPICRACRLRKCVDLGMEFFPRAIPILEVSPSQAEELPRLLKDLIAMDSSQYLRLMSFYTEDDPTLEEVLEGTRVIVVKKEPQRILSPEEWSFFTTYMFVSSFMTFSFVEQLPLPDKVILFRSSIIQLGFLCSSMRNMRNRMDSFTTPDGQDFYPEELIRILNIDPVVIKRICSMLVSRMIELHVTQEEALLLNMIFFCNPALPNLTISSQSILGKIQKMYTSSLFKYCQVKYQNTAPSRLGDLLSLFHIINKTYEDMQYIVMAFECAMPSFESHKLAKGILHSMKS